MLPFGRFPDADTVLGPEMRSTGEVMGIDRTFGLAFAKCQMAAGDRLPVSGSIFLSLADRDKPGGLVVARRLADLGFTIAATAGTAAYVEANGVTVDMVVGKLTDGDTSMPTAVELLATTKVNLVINTPRGSGPRSDGHDIRSAARLYRVPCLTTVAAGLAAAQGIADWVEHGLHVRTLQEHHQAGRGEQLELS